MPTTPFGAALEAALKETIQGGKLELLTGLVYNPKFYCCISGTTVGLNKDPVPVLVVSPTQTCFGNTTNADYSRSWSGTDTLAGNPWQVDWGDGNVSNGNFPNPRNPAVENVNHPLGGYAAIGVYDITLTVTDTLGATGSVMVQAEVIECAPVPGPGVAPVYASCGLSGVWLSLDLGQTWTQIGDGLLATAEVRDMKPMLATIANAAIHIWVASECGVYFTQDSGDTWWHVDLPSAESSTPDFADPYAIACEKLGDNTVYVLATDGYMGGVRPLLYRTTNQGLSWDFVPFSALDLGEPSYMIWEPMHDGTIVDDITQYVSYSDGTLLAVGEWLFGANTRYLAIWDGTNWSAASITGLPVVGQIYHAAISSSDTLYILGEWDFGAGLEAAVYYWHIGISSWVKVGVQVAIGSGTHHLSIAPNGYVYAGVADKLYRVQDPGWVTIATLWYTPPTVPHVNDIKYIGSNEFYVGGLFETINGAGAYWNIARYDGSFHTIGAGLQFYNPEALAVDPTTGYIYTGTNDNDDDRVFTYWNGSTWVHMTGYGFSFAEPENMYYRDGYIYICGQEELLNDGGQVLRYDIANDEFQVFLNTSPSWPGGSSIVYDIHWPANSPWTYVCGDFTNPPSGAGINASYSNEYNMGWLIYDTGMTYAVDVSSDGQYVFVVLDINLLGVTHAPVVIRLNADLTGQEFVQELSGTWGGVQCDNTIPGRVWLFGDFTPFDKIRLSDDYGDTIATRDDASWNGNEVVRPLLINPYNPNHICAILNFDNETWVSLDAGVTWSQVGSTNTPFDAQSGAIDPYNDLILMIGRDSIGANHLQMSADLGYNWIERSTGITAQAPITAIFMVK